MFPPTARAGFWGYEGARIPFLGKIYAAPMETFSDEEYRGAVEWALATLESQSGRSLGPDVYRRAGMNINTNSGNGLQTPPGLVRAVIEALVARGYSREELFIVDTKTTRLRDAGYLPALSRHADGPYFDGVPVYGLDDGDMWNDVWFYENPLPVPYNPELGRRIMDGDADLPEQRKSYLAQPLLTDVDFWINLPVITDHPALEVNGALANATLWSVSNRDRFFSSPANAPVAMAEIAAIPELLSNMAVTIVSLEKYQFIAGPYFNSLYCRTEPVVLASVDPVILDAWCSQLINERREEVGFRTIASPPQAAIYAQVLGVGLADTSGIAWEQRDL